jgi:hypothetical protein
MKLSKEEIYDAKIAPLMKQIIAICKRHKIANVCTFSLDIDNGLLCTTAMIETEFEPPDTFKEIIHLIYSPQRSPMMITVRDGNGDVKEMHAIL